MTYVNNRLARKKKCGEIRAKKEKPMKSPLLLGIETHFATVRDPRQYGKVDHPLINIIFITLCGVV